jgi:GrpB-like predicted nucleotidyltransferase (UPF0157 family)
MASFDEDREMKASRGTAAVAVVDYDPDWPLRFGRLSDLLMAALTDVAVTIEHVGSTAVPGLAAKPIIDIDVVVASPTDVPRAIERLQALGYQHEGDLGIAGREAFRQPARLPAHHLYLVVQDSPAYADHVDLRDYLRNNPDATEQYAALKKLLARQGLDRDGYMRAKAEFIAAALTAARGQQTGG